MTHVDTDGNRMIWDETLRQWVPVTGSMSPAELANEINPILSSRFAPKTGSESYVAQPMLWLPGVNGNYVSCPDSAALDITGSIEIVVLAGLDDWTPAANSTLVGKWATGSYLVRVTTTGRLAYFDGTAYSAGVFSDVLTRTDGTMYWSKITHNTTTGLVSFYTADYANSLSEPTSWTLVSSTGSTTGTRSATTDVLTIGANDNTGTTTPAAGKFGRVIIRNGIGGTVVADWSSAIPATRTRDAYGNIFTLNGTGSGFQA